MPDPYAIEISRNNLGADNLSERELTRQIQAASHKQSAERIKKALENDRTNYTFEDAAYDLCEIAIDVKRWMRNSQIVSDTKWGFRANENELRFTFSILLVEVDGREMQGNIEFDSGIIFASDFQERLGNTYYKRREIYDQVQTVSSEVRDIMRKVENKDWIGEDNERVKADYEETAIHDALLRRAV